MEHEAERRQLEELTGRPSYSTSRLPKLSPFCIVKWRNPALAFKNHTRGLILVGYGKQEVIPTCLICRADNSPKSSAQNQNSLWASKTGNSGYTESVCGRGSSGVCGQPVPRATALRSRNFTGLVARSNSRLAVVRSQSRIGPSRISGKHKPTGLNPRPASMRFCRSRALPTPRMPRRRASTQGKCVTFGVTRGCIAVASPVSSITWLIAP
jgi:hypothetical protein